MDQQAPMIQIHPSRVTDFVKAFSGELAADLATKLTCSEVETLAEFLDALGAPDTAAAWLECHAEGDYPGDSHYTGSQDDAS